MTHINTITANKKKFLYKAKNLEIEIQSYQRELEKIEHLKTRVKAIDYSKEQIRGGNKNSWESLIDKADMYKKSINETIIELFESKLKIKEKIDEVKDSRERSILVLKYIEYKSMNEICRYLDLSVDSINKIHTQALKNLRI